MSPTPTPTRSVVAGKFLPPHPGHSLVIDSALTECSAVDVIVCDRPGERPPATERAEWLRILHPTATVHVVADICAWHGDEACRPECSPAWADHLRASGLGPWTHVHGSEDYIEGFAASLGAVPRLVDPERRRLAVCGSAIRADLGGHWLTLAPVVRAGLARRVVVVGAESTGTTTLARDLGARLGFGVVPEYGRTFSAARAAACGSIFDVVWSPADFLHVARHQERLEHETLHDWSTESSTPGPLELGAPLLVCDTDVLATAVWHRRYIGHPAPALLDQAAARPPLLYVLTSPKGVGFHQDGLRDGEALRDAMTGWFREALESQASPSIEVTGTRTERVSAVCRWLATNAGPALATSSEAQRTL